MIEVNKIAENSEEIIESVESEKTVNIEDICAGPKSSNPSRRETDLIVFSPFVETSTEEAQAFEEEPKQQSAEKESKSEAEALLEQQLAFGETSGGTAENSTEQAAEIVSSSTSADTASEPLDIPMIPQDQQLSSQNAAAPEAWKRIVQGSEDETLGLNVTPQMMDESVISVQESPAGSYHPPRDSTFSPIVDTSIQDSRPIINASVVTPKSVALRTSTPYASKAQKAKVDENIETGTPTKRLNASKSKRLGDEKKEKLHQTLNKSILKSTRKRSLSVTDAESFMHKRVMFNSPKVMRIDAIDEKMMASFIEEKENSVMNPAPTSARRKRSFSTGTPSKNELPSLRSKMPNFKAIHELQFQKMESIADHAQRKAQRAKQLGTPSRDEAKKNQPCSSNQLEESKRAKLHAISKIPTRSALVPSMSTDNFVQGGGRKLKRSMSANTDELPSKKAPILVPSFSIGSHDVRFANVPKKQPIAVVFPRSNGENAASTSQRVPQNRGKVEERREKNLSLFKSKAVSSRTDRRAQSLDILKGVRLNRRFELQMQHRRDLEQNEKPE